MTATILLSSAMICFQGHCYPALVGADTPIGVFEVHRERVSNPGYGGDILSFYEQSDEVWAVHRLWLGNPRQHRAERLESHDPRQRHITMGCVNVSPQVYDELRDLTVLEIRQY